MISSLHAKTAKRCGQAISVMALALPLTFSAAMGDAGPLHALVWSDRGPDAYIVHNAPAVLENDPGIYIALNDADTNCAAPIALCGYNFAPASVSEGAAITLRINSAGFEARYVCGRVNNHLAWVQSGTTGSCTSAQIIEIPATYTREKIRNMG